MSESRKTDLMSREEALSALGELAYDFHNEMVRRGIKELPASDWLERFRSWMPSGPTFARAHKERSECLAEMERAGRNN